MNAIAFLIESLITSFATAFLIEFVRTGYGFTQGDFVWFDSCISSWGIALGIHAVEFLVKLASGSLDDEELPQSLMRDEYIQPKQAKDYGTPLQ